MEPPSDVGREKAGDGYDPQWKPKREPMARSPSRPRRAPILKQHDRMADGESAQSESVFRVGHQREARHGVSHRSDGDRRRKNCQPWSMARCAEAPTASAPKGEQNAAIGVQRSACRVP